MEILQGFVDAVVGIFEDSGLLTLNWQNYVMIGISIVLLYLAIKKQYEPLLLLPIAFGMLLVNLYPSIIPAYNTAFDRGSMYRTECCGVGTRQNGD